MWALTQLSSFTLSPHSQEEKTWCPGDLPHLLIPANHPQRGVVIGPKRAGRKDACSSAVITSGIPSSIHRCRQATSSSDSRTLSFYSEGLRGVSRCLPRRRSAFPVFEPGILTHREGCLWPPVPQCVPLQRRWGGAEDEEPLFSQVGHFGHEESRGIQGSAGSGKKKLEADQPGKGCSCIDRFSQHLSHPHPCFIIYPPAF